MAYRAVQANFSKGEISDDLLGRFDVSAYSAGLKRARNVIIMKYGGVTKRPGTRIVAECHAGSPDMRLLPFQYSLDQAYALEMGQGYMRPAALGGMVLHEELAITAITNAANAQVAIAYHGFSVGDQVFFRGVEGMTEINGRVFSVASVVDAGHFTIDADSRGWGAFTSAAHGITRTEPPPPDEPEPTVPPVSPPPPPPPVYGGGSGSGGGGSGDGGKLPVIP